jgi:cobalt-zinc-cadmium efflux system membrane fusion protein
MVLILGIIVAQGISYGKPTGTEYQHHNHDDHVDMDNRHDEQKEKQSLRFSEAELNELGIEVKTAGPEKLQLSLELLGEIVLNADNVAHVVPRVSGVIREVRKKLGDRVKADEVMAVMESRELADAKAAYLAAQERFRLAQANLEREKKLWKKQITSEQEYLNARQAEAEVHIEVRLAEQKLYALGFSENFLQDLTNQPDTNFTRYEIRAPFNGSVIEKHMSLGESVEKDSRTFVVADLSTVWLDLAVYPKDLAAIRKGQKVIVKMGSESQDVTNSITYISPVVNKATRTAIARAVLPNPERKLRPGLFVTTKVIVDTVKASVIILKTALQTLEDSPVVFVRMSEGFEPRQVKLGRSDEISVEIVSGLAAGEKYVAKGSFTLKAQILKSSFDSGHDH